MVEHFLGFTRLYISGAPLRDSGVLLFLSASCSGVDRSGGERVETDNRLRLVYSLGLGLSESTQVGFKGWVSLVLSIILFTTQFEGPKTYQCVVLY